MPLPIQLFRSTPRRREEEEGRGEWATLCEDRTEDLGAQTYIVEGLANNAISSPSRGGVCFLYIGSTDTKMEKGRGRSGPSTAD